MILIRVALVISMMATTILAGPFSCFEAKCDVTAILPLEKIEDAKLHLGQTREMFVAAMTAVPRSSSPAKIMAHIMHLVKPPKVDTDLRASYDKTQKWLEQILGPEDSKVDSKELESEIMEYMFSTIALLRQLAAPKIQEKTKKGTPFSNHMDLGEPLRVRLKDPEQYLQQIKGQYVLLEQLRDLGLLDKLRFSSKVKEIAERS